MLNSLTTIRSTQNLGPDLGPICLKGYQQMTMSCLSLTQSQNTSVQLQFVLTSKASNSLAPIRSRQNVGPDPGPNCLKGLSADGNVIF